MSEENYQNMPETLERGFYLERDQNKKTYIYHFCLAVGLFVLVSYLFNKIFPVFAFMDISDELTRAAVNDTFHAKFNLKDIIGSFLAYIQQLLLLLVLTAITWWLFRIIIGIWNRIRNYRLKYYQQ